MIVVVVVIVVIIWSTIAIDHNASRQEVSTSTPALPFQLATETARDGGCHSHSYHSGDYGFSPHETPMRWQYITDRHSI